MEVLKILVSVYAHPLNELPVYPVRNVSTAGYILLFLLVMLSHTGSACFFCYIMAFLMQGIITAPMLYAMEEFPQLHDVIDQGFDNPANVELVSNYLYQEWLLSISLFIHSTYRVKTIFTLFALLHLEAYAH
jgi:hypothetical protein